MRTILFEKLQNEIGVIYFVLISKTIELQTYFLLHTRIRVENNFHMRAFQFHMTIYSPGFSL